MSPSSSGDKHSSAAGRQLTPAMPAPSNTASKSMAAVFPQWYRIAKLWYTGEEKWWAWGYSAACVGLALGTTGFYVHISYAQRDFSTAMSDKDVPGFYAAVRKFVIIIIIAAPLFSFTTWVEERLILAWRAYLTRHLARAYFRDRAFYLIQLRGDYSGSGEGGAAGGTTAGVAAAAGGAGGSTAGIDNPDQRICDDVASFVRSSVSIVLSLFKKVFNCVAFASVLWNVSSELVLLLFLYAGFGTIITTYVFGRPLTDLYYRVLAREADLRFSLVRVRENAEAIAFYRGESGERRRVLSRLGSVLQVSYDRIRLGAYYDLWTSVYSYATILVPSLLTAPRYFRGEIEFGVISQASYAFGRIESALSIIIMNLAAISGLAAGSERLDALMAAIEAADKATSGSDTAALLLSSASIQRRFEAGVAGVALQRLCVAAPGSGGGEMLCKDLTLTMEQGQSLLVVGPSGCGKSSLLRAIAGLWTAGSGTVLLPAPERCVFFLPQRAFMPLGSLRAQLTFPAGLQSEAASEEAAGGGAKGLRRRVPSKRAAAGGGGNSDGDQEEGRAREDPDTADKDKEMAPLLHKKKSDDPGAGDESDSAAADPTSPSAAQQQQHGQPPLAVTDSELLSLLDDVCLPELGKRFGGLDVSLDWSSVLSVGEQQRVALLRLLLCAPRVAFLDEATSALDGPTEARLYALLKKRVGCYVSVGHRMQLLTHHSHVLEAKGGGEWELSTSAEYQKRMAQRTGLHL